MLELFDDYLANGFTSICDRDASEDEIQQYRELHRDGKLKLPVSLSQHIETIGPMEDIERNIPRVAGDPLVNGGDWLKIVGIKTYLDGGMLTGSAYMRAPWGVSKIYSITDPQYRSVLSISRERLLPIVKTTLESGLQFTAHTVALETGNLADLIILDTDILTCPVDDIRKTHVLQTYVSGKLVFERM